MQDPKIWKHINIGTGNPRTEGLRDWEVGEAFIDVTVRCDDVHDIILDLPRLVVRWNKNSSRQVLQIFFRDDI